MREKLHNEISEVDLSDSVLNGVHLHLHRGDIEVEDTASDEQLALRRQRISSEHRSLLPLLEWIDSSEEFSRDPELAKAIGDADLQDFLQNSRSFSFSQTLELEPSRYICSLINQSLGLDIRVLEHEDGILLYREGVVRNSLKSMGLGAWWTHSAKHEFERDLAKLITTRPGVFEALLDDSATRSLATKGSQDQQTRQPRLLREIYIPTANRPEHLERLLSGLRDNFTFFGYDPRSIRITIVDSSTNPELREHNSAICNKFVFQGLDVDYAPPRAIQRFLEMMKKRIPPQQRESFEALFQRGLYGDGEDPVTIGTIRNIMSLAYADRAHLGLDDDVLPSGNILNYSEFKNSKPPELHLDPNVGSIGDFGVIQNYGCGEFEQVSVQIPTDIIGITDRNLGMPADVIEHRVVGSSEAKVQITDIPSVNFVRMYLTNTSPDVLTFLKQFSSTGDFGKLTGESIERMVSRDSSSAIFPSGYSFGTNYATDQALAAPFLDTKAYEDVAQTNVSDLAQQNTVQFQGGAIEHRRFVGPRAQSLDGYLEATLPHLIISRFLSSVFPGSLARTSLRSMKDPEEIFSSLAESLRSTDPSKLLAEDYFKSLKAAVKQFGKRLRKHAPEDAKTFRVSDTELREKAEATLGKLLERNATLYELWPNLTRAARSLRNAVEYEVAAKTLHEEPNQSQVSSA